MYYRQPSSISNASRMLGIIDQVSLARLAGLRAVMYKPTFHISHSRTNNISYCLIFEINSIVNFNCFVLDVLLFILNFSNI